MRPKDMLVSVKFSKRLIASILGNSNNHINYLDNLRTFATILVLVTHTISLESIAMNTIFFYLLTILKNIALCCNFLFVMMSGILLLPNKNESLFTFYRKRFAKIFIPLVLYYYIYYYWNGQFAFTGSFLCNSIKEILSGASEMNPHFWLIYVIMDLYVLVPFQRYFMQSLSLNIKKQLLGFLICFYIVKAIFYFLCGHELRLDCYLFSWYGIFVSGYLLIQTQWIYKHSITIYIMGVFSFLILSYILLVQNGNTNIYYTLYQYSSFMFLISFAILTGFANHITKSHLFGKIISKYSYSILLIHWYILNTFIPKYCHSALEITSNSIFNIVLKILLTLFISLFLAIIIDNTIMRFLNSKCDKLLEWIGRNFKL